MYRTPLEQMLGIFLPDVRLLSRQTATLFLDERDQANKHCLLHALR